jgi:hypothetical protein
MHACDSTPQTNPQRYEALKHVSFAVQTLGKCAKMFPVMAWGFLMLRKRYGARDVALAAAITGGCFVFFTFGPTASRCARRVAGAPPAAGGGGRAGRGWRGQRGWRGRRGRWGRRRWAASSAAARLAWASQGWRPLVRMGTALLWAARARCGLGVLCAASTVGPNVRLTAATAAATAWLWPCRRVSGGPGGTAWGVLLMSGYLVADGYTSTFQQAM